MAYDSTRSLVRAALGIALVLGGQQLFAAETPAANSTDPGEGLEEVTVTGSRIEHSGFQAPTPVSVLDISQVEDRGATNIANVINEIPAFTGTITPASTGLNSRQNGINAVDLRGLGTNRNLVLLNGRRGTPFDEFGNVDLNAVPSLAIGRVEVVTGGASAAWGSDAISGVVNLIYDEELEGFKFNAQYGQSEHGDAEDTRLAGAWGKSLNGGAGHFLIAADYNKNEGVPEGKDRDWQRRSPALVVNPNAAGPQFQIRDNAVLFLGSPNGVSWPSSIVGGSVDNYEFFPDGTARPRQLGDWAENAVDNFMIGGRGSRLGDRSAIFIPTERFNVLATFQHDIGDHTEAFVEASFAQSKSEGKLVDAFTFGDVTITPDNPYLPANIAALGEEFSLFRTFEEVPPITSESKNDNVRLVAGLKGDFGNSFKWNASGQFGRTKFSNVQPSNLLVGNLILAADAVRDPVSGNIVCRANLNGANGAPGCAPINLFGKGSPSAAALDYVFGRGTSDTEIKQTVFMADVGGELVDLWAGPLLGTFGVEYRKEELDRVVNEPNENAEFLIVNAQPLSGEFNTKEGFVEFALPLLKADQQTLDLNAAARVTDYSTVGSVTTWKTGLVYSPIESLRFRGSISQDIRAPSIGETFVKTVLLFSQISNPFPNPGGEPITELVETPTQGNPDLKEETAKTTTFGVVYSAGGFRSSVDWYHIDLTDTIGALSPQSVVNRCAAGETNLCDLITFNPDGSGSIDSISGKNINLGTFDLEGIDAELRYTQPVGNGDLSVGLIGSYLLHKEIAPSGGAVVDTAGEVGTASGFGTPDFKATLSVSYDIGDWGAYGQARYIGSGVYDATYGPEDLASSENDIGSVTYVDLSAHYDLHNLGYGQVTIFGGVDNAFDKDPPAIPLNFISNAATNGAIYDVIGRKYYVGARMKF